ncbi:MAG: prolyl oligopeptidase family serine peptidase [Ignavibacteriaceae bacterium]
MKLIFSLLILLVLTSLSLPQGKRPLTPEDLWKMKRVGSFEISPDNKFGAYVLTEYNVSENKGYSDIYLIDLSTKETMRLTTAKAGDAAPVWSPDSKKIAFLSRREDDEKSQIYIIGINGGEAERFTELPNGASSVKWFPDGSKIAFASNTFPGITNMDDLKKELKKRKDDKVTAKTTENRFYRYWDTWLTDGFVTHLYSLDLKTKTVTDLTPGNEAIFSYSGSGASYDVSPDGKTIALSANVTPPPYTKPLNFDIFLLNTDGSGEMKNITPENPSDDSSPLFAKGGSSLIYSFTERMDVIAENSKLAEYDLKSGKRTVLTAGYDYSVSDFLLTDDNSRIFFTAESRARTGIFTVDGKGKNFRRLFENGTISGLRYGKDKLYFIFQDFTNPPFIVALDPAKEKFEKIISFNDALLDSIDFGKFEDITFTGAGGDKVQMWLVYPPGFDKNKKYPLVHIIHGGPLGTSSNDFHYRWNAQMFAAMGYVIAEVNFHGSSSFGEQFAQSLKGAQADFPFRDVMLATDYLIEEYNFIDSKKLGAAGGSYGGYLTNWIAGHTDRFSALISHAGVYNLMGQFASDLTHFREISYGGSPWNKPDIVMSMSPAQFAENFKTPMMIVHGEKDYRVVVTQGLELYGVLQGKGIPSRLVCFPDENHWVLSPQNSIFWYKEFKSWMDRWLK